MSKLKGILLLLIAAIVMGCSSQPKQPKEEPVAEKQQAETAPAEEKLQNRSKTRKIVPVMKQRFILLRKRIKLIRSLHRSWTVLPSC